MKAANSYASLLRGVSQQVPQERAEGQHTEQVNMLSDPVRGLVRRPGTILDGEKLEAGLSSLATGAYDLDAVNYRTFDFQNLGKEYSVMYRTAERPAYGVSSPLPLFVVYNKTDRVFLDLVRPAVDSLMDSLEQGGVAAITAVGKYVLLSANNVNIQGTTTPSWLDNNPNTVVWFKSGTYSRTFTVRVTKLDGTVSSWTYTTLSSSYPLTLDTSDILSSDPEYTKKINDRVNAYNSAVTEWIGQSSQSIQPDNIANVFASWAVTELGGANVYRIGSHVALLGVKAVEVNDGGDGSFIAGVANTVSGSSDVSKLHFDGKVVKVNNRNSSEVYYLKAALKNASTVFGNGFGEVTWSEGAGVVHTINSGLFYCTVQGNSFMTASSASALATITAGPHPDFEPSTVGDLDSSPAPYFVGRKITYLGVFKNRLLIGSGGNLSLSKTNDYLNFFRSTVLTLPADDAFEMLPQGSEDDVLRYGVLYDQDLVIFGKDKQYVTRGDQALAATAANMAVMSNFGQAANSPPLAAGSYIFYNKGNTKFTGLFQVQPGQTENSPDSFPASSQVNSYLQGTAIEMAVSTGSPSMLFLRTQGYSNGVYLFSYLDRQDGRKMDSWSKVDFNPALGYLLGMSVVPSGLMLYFLRVGQGLVYTVADILPLNPEEGLPHLDSQRPYASVESNTGSVRPSTPGPWAAVYGPQSTRHYLGSPLADAPALRALYPLETDMVVGALQSAFVIPTNPYMRDGKDKAILSGRLTITKLTVAYQSSVGFKWSVNYRDQIASESSFTGRVLGDPTNLIGKITVSNGQHTIPIGRETRQYELTISARDWYPFTLAAIEWTGQFFNRVQRF